MDLLTTFDHWHAAHPHASIETVRHYRQSLRRLAAVGISKSRDATRENWARYQSARLMAGKQPGTVNAEQNALMTMLWWLADRGELSREVPTVLAKLRLPSEASPPLDYYTPEEYQSLLAGAKRRWFRFSLVVACYTGVRVGELRRLNVEDFDLPAKVLRLRAEIAKGRKARVISLCGSVLRTLERELPKNGPVFPADHDDSLSVYRCDDAFQRRIRDLGRELGIRATFHRCRRTFTTWSL